MRRTEYGENDGWYDDELGYLEGLDGRQEYLDIETPHHISLAALFEGARMADRHDSGMEHWHEQQS